MQNDGIGETGVAGFDGCIDIECEISDYLLRFAHSFCMHLPTLVFLLARPLLPIVPGNFFAQCGLMVMSVRADSLLLHHALQRMLMFAGQNQTSRDRCGGRPNFLLRFKCTLRAAPLL
jgi:hypothetical protein